MFHSFVFFPQSVNEDENLKGKVNFDLEITRWLARFSNFFLLIIHFRSQEAKCES